MNSYSKSIFSYWSVYLTGTVALEILLKNQLCVCACTTVLAEDEEIHVGGQFPSFELLEATVKHFKEQQMVTYWIRDSRKASAYQKQQGDRIVSNQALV